MKRYDVVVENLGPGITLARVDQCEDGGYYRVSDADARIAELTEALKQREAQLHDVFDVHEWSCKACGRTLEPAERCHCAKP